MHRVLDAPFLELLWDFPADQGSTFLPAFTCRYYRGLCGDRPAWILPYLCEQGQFNMQPPRAECDLRELTVFTNGCIPAQGRWQQNADTPDIGKLEPGERRMPAHMESAVGVFRAMMEDHLPLDIVIEPDLEDAETLQQYKVRIVPNAACLSDKATATIRALVNADGGQVAMHESSICY